MKRVAVTFLLFACIEGCGGSPRLDASSDATLEASTKRITAGMTEEQKKAFVSDMGAAVLPGAMKSVFENAFKKGANKTPPQSGHEVFKPLHGMTASEIHAKADRERQQLKERFERKQP
jgi:hypothetical protein